MELDLVTALAATNITVLQPSHIQQEDKPLDVPYLFVRIPCVDHVQITTIILHTTCFISQYVVVQYSSPALFFVQFHHYRQSTQE